MADQEQQQPVVIGMDPHKRSVTIEVMTADESILGGGRYGTDQAGFTAMLRYVRQFPDRVWAIEGCCTCPTRASTAPCSSSPVVRYAAS